MLFIKQTDQFKVPNSVITIYEGNDYLYYWKIEGELNDNQVAPYGKHTRHEAIVSALDNYSNHVTLKEYTFKMIPEYFSADFGEQTVNAFSYENAVTKLDREGMLEYDLIEAK